MSLSFMVFWASRWEMALRIVPFGKPKYYYHKSQNSQIILSWFVLKLRWFVPSLSQFLHKTLVDSNLSQQACRMVMFHKNDDFNNIIFLLCFRDNDNVIDNCFIFKISL